jgi:hypothetical protein
MREPVAADLPRLTREDAQPALCLVTGATGAYATNFGWAKSKSSPQTP